MDESGGLWRNVKQLIFQLKFVFKFKLIFQQQFIQFIVQRGMHPNGDNTLPASGRRNLAADRQRNCPRRRQRAVRPAACIRNLGLEWLRYLGFRTGANCISSFLLYGDGNLYQQLRCPKHAKLCGDR